MFTNSLFSTVGNTPPKKWKVYVSCQADERAIVHPLVGSMYSYYLFGLDREISDASWNIHQRHQELTEQGFVGGQTPTESTSGKKLERLNKLDVALLSYDPDLPGVDEQIDGIIDRLKANNPDLHIIEQPVESPADYEAGQTSLETFVDDHKGKENVLIYNVLHGRKPAENPQSNNLQGTLVDTNEGTTITTEDDLSVYMSSLTDKIRGGTLILDSCYSGAFVD